MESSEQNYKDKLKEMKPPKRYAKDVEKGDLISHHLIPKKDGVIEVQTIIREGDTDISDATRKAVKGKILFTYNNSKKVIIPLEDEVEFWHEETNQRA